MRTYIAYYIMCTFDQSMRYTHMLRNMHISTCTTRVRMRSLKQRFSELLQVQPEAVFAAELERIIGVVERFHYFKLMEILLLVSCMAAIMIYRRRVGVGSSVEYFGRTTSTQLAKKL